MSNKERDEGSGVACDASDAGSGNTLLPTPSQLVPSPLPPLPKVEPPLHDETANKYTQVDYLKVTLGEQSSDLSAMNGMPRDHHTAIRANEEQMRKRDKHLLPSATKSCEMLSHNQTPISNVTFSQQSRSPGVVPSSKGWKSSQRTRLLVFVKIILKCLDYEDPSLHLEAKQIITDCTQKNRQGIPGYDSLADAITSQLRMTVGEVHWSRAEGLMDHYLKTRPGTSDSGMTMLKRAAV